jgi:hypothetical protein
VDDSFHDRIYPSTGCNFQLGKQSPSLVNDHNGLRATNPRGRLASQVPLQPGGGTRHQHTQRGRLVKRRQIEDDQRRGQIQSRRRRPIEHAAQVTMHQPPQLERHVTAVFEEVTQVRS